jgi:hypothetical protein
VHTSCTPVTSAMHQPQPKDRTTHLLATAQTHD